MLSNVLGAYLDGSTERELDLPFLLLLPALGFHDVHLTHGNVEFGTDFIAKKLVNGHEVQYAFQSKAIDIDLREWRNNVRGQLESAQAGVIHPNFNNDLERQVVLVTSGELNYAASIEMQRWNDDRSVRNGMRPVPVWSKQNVLEFLLERGLNGVHRATAGGFGEFGRFFLTYSRALQGVITVQEIERYSRQWADADVDPERRLLLAAIESEVLAQQCVAHDLVYEAIQFHLARLRLLCELAYADGAVPRPELWDAAVAQLHALCADYIGRVREAWTGDKDLLNTWAGDLHMNTYLVQCARIIEIAGLGYFTAADDEDRDQYVEFVAEFVQAEPGCAHPSATATPPRSFSRSSCCWTASAPMSPMPCSSTPRSGSTTTTIANRDWQASKPTRSVKRPRSWGQASNSSTYTRGAAASWRRPCWIWRLFPETQSSTRTWSTTSRRSGSPRSTGNRETRLARFASRERMCCSTPMSSSPILFRSMVPRMLIT
jgi:hypothetical protein